MYGVILVLVVKNGWAGLDCNIHHAGELCVSE